jgi:hypothetical protein
MDAFDTTKEVDAMDAMDTSKVKQQSQQQAKKRTGLGGPMKNAEEY